MAVLKLEVRLRRLLRIALPEMEVRGAVTCCSTDYLNKRRLRFKLDPAYYEDAEDQRRHEYLIATRIASLAQLNSDTRHSRHAIYRLRVKKDLHHENVYTTSFYTLSRHACVYSWQAVLWPEDLPIRMRELPRDTAGMVPFAVRAPIEKSEAPAYLDAVGELVARASPIRLKFYGLRYEEHVKRDGSAERKMLLKFWVPLRDYTDACHANIEAVLPSATQLSPALVKAMLALSDTADPHLAEFLVCYRPRAYDKHREEVTRANCNLHLYRGKSLARLTRFVCERRLHVLDIRVKYGYHTGFVRLAVYHAPAPIELEDEENDSRREKRPKKSRTR